MVDPVPLGELREEFGEGCAPSFGDACEEDNISAANGCR